VNAVGLFRCTFGAESSESTETFELSNTRTSQQNSSREKWSASVSVSDLQPFHRGSSWLGVSALRNPSRARSKYPSRSRLNPPESARNHLTQTKDEGYDDGSKDAQRRDYRQPEKQFLHDIQLN
jgi:hypothetical protein